MKSRFGFTLIEILIAMAIVGILASAALVGLGSVQQAARDTRRVQDLRSVQTGLELYYRRYGEYPCGTGGCASGGGSVDWPSLSGTLEDVSGSKIPQDPRAGRGHNDYEYGSDGSSYVLKATLETEDNVLTTDVDGQFFNNAVDCDDNNNQKFYCIRF